VTRLDRWETSLNEALAGDPRDTTSPRAMAGDLKSVLLGHVLSRRSRDQLTLWMVANLTGIERLRAGLPAGWRAADKTGANRENTSNDIAVLWPTGKPPLIVTAYITQCAGPESTRTAMLAKIGELVRGPLL
jgi:beta-lactamase class A